jgi:hypothetical protein
LFKLISRKFHQLLNYRNMLQFVFFNLKLRIKTECAHIFPPYILPNITRSKCKHGARHSRRKITMSIGYALTPCCLIVGHSISSCHTVFAKLYLSMALESFLLDLGRFFSFLIMYTVGRTPWARDQPVARSLPTQRTTQTQNKRAQTSMP